MLGFSGFPRFLTWFGVGLYIFLKPGIKIVFFSLFLLVFVGPNEVIVLDSPFFGFERDGSIHLFVVPFLLITCDGSINRNVYVFCCEKVHYHCLVHFVYSFLLYFAFLRLSLNSSYLA